MKLTLQDVQHHVATINAGNRRIEIAVAQLVPTGSPLRKTDALADFRLGESAEGKDVMAQDTRSGYTRYTGIIPSKISPERSAQRLCELIYTILRDAGEHKRSRLWLNFSDNPSWRHLSTSVDDYLGFLKGISSYAHFVEDKEPESHVGEIIIGCGAITYNTLSSSPQLVGNLIVSPGIFLPSMIISV